MPPFFYYHIMIQTILLLFAFGLIFGSFANVCIYRWPRNGSTSVPRRSYCPWCQHDIAWRDNIPVWSFLLLRGRCRHCRSPISVRYPLVEIAMGLLWVLAGMAVKPRTIDDLPFLIVA